MAAARICAAIGAVLLVVTSASAGAQTVPPQNDVVVKGRLTPGAEAPRSATCEMLAQSPQFSAWIARSSGDPMMMPTIRQPTRLPRNPDYRAPPRVPVGSPLPDLPKSRFGAGPSQAVIPIANAPDTFVVEALDAGTGEAAGETLSLPANDTNAALALCRSMFSRGRASGPTESDAAASYTNPFGDRQQRLNEQRNKVVASDTTLPMAFALFDQGRYAEAYGFFKAASDKLNDEEGGDEARLFLGKLQLAGFGPTKDPAAAIGWLKQAADGNFNALTDMPQFDPTQPQRNTAMGEAAMILASIYGRGMPGVSQDMAVACKWYQRAEDVGHVAAGRTLGDIYARGLSGVPRDPRKAVAAYRRAARLDLPSAQVALAGLLEGGAPGIKPDVKTAMGWYTRAATKHQDPQAMYALALAYDTGQGGVTVDPANAFALFKAAALKGVPGAMAAVGTFFQDGTVVKQDQPTARKWFEAAAKDGNPDGMYYLAAMLANGRGGSRDFVQAWVWLTRAAKLGQGDAPAALAKLEAIMTPGDRAAAERGRGG